MSADLYRRLLNTPDRTNRNEINLVYRPVQDTCLVGNGNREISFFTNDLFVGGVAKDKYEKSFVNPGKGIFGAADAWLVGVRVVLPRYLADGTTPLTFVNASNLLRAFADQLIDQKPSGVKQTRLEDLPQGQGIYYQASEVTAAAPATVTAYTNGPPARENRFIFEQPIRYLNNEKYEFLVTYPAAAGAVVTANAHLVVILDAFVEETL